MGARGPQATAARLKRIEEPEKPPRMPRWQWRNQTRIGRVIAFCQSLPVTKGKFSGQRLRLRPWQRKIIKAIYETDADGLRIIRTALITIPRKNGKTQLAAALALCHLIGPESESRGEVYSAAADRDQASIVFAEMVAMITDNPAFIRRTNIQTFKKHIEDYETGSTYWALSSDARKAHGLNTSFVVYDELAQSRSRELYENLSTSVGAREEPLFIVISTQAANDQHVMSELVDYGEKVLAGTIEDPTFLPIIYKAPASADPWDEKTWFDCNPALDDFRSLAEFRDFAKKAKRMPSLETVFRSLYLNQRVGSATRFINAFDWLQCGRAVDREALAGEICYAGLDLSSTRDLTALVLYFPDSGCVIPFHWIPGDDMAAREDSDRVPYRTWKRDGFIEAHDGRAVDKMAVAFRLAELAVEFDIQLIAYDRWRIDELTIALAKEGIDDLPLVAFGQGFKDMGPATDLLETVILDGTLKHGNHPVLAWCASNAAVLVDPTGAKKLAKNKSIGRIDGLVALAMAIGISARHEVEASYYDSPEFLNIAAN